MNKITKKIMEVRSASTVAQFLSAENWNFRTSKMIHRWYVNHLQEGHNALKEMFRNSTDLRAILSKLTREEKKVIGRVMGQARKEGLCLGISMGTISQHCLPQGINENLDIIEDWLRTRPSRYEFIEFCGLQDGQDNLLAEIHHMDGGGFRLVRGETLAALIKSIAEELQTTKGQP